MEKKTQNWWAKLGKPQYGGEMTVRIQRISTFLTVLHRPSLPGLFNLDGKLFADDWTTDTEVYGYKIGFHPASL